MHYDRTVIGYHGCSANTARSVLNGKPFKVSRNQWDWLGEGIYFWEFGLDRAWTWARNHHRHRAAVVGAIIQLADCFDLFDTRHTAELAAWAKLYDESARKARMKIPTNKGRDRDRTRRYLDCAVINWSLERMKGGDDGKTYRSVRCGFTEGGPIFQRSNGRNKMAICKQTHIQIAVRDPSCIVGVFSPTNRRSA